MAETSEARKRREALFSEPQWSPSEDDASAVVDDVRLSAAEVWPGCEHVDAEALLDQLADRGLRVVRA